VIDKNDNSDEEVVDKNDTIPKWERLTDEFVESNKDTVFKMAQVGCTDKEQAHILSISETNLRGKFRKQIDEGRSQLRRSLRRAQLDAAINGKNPTMLIWLGKNYLGQREPKAQMEHSGGITVEKVIFKATEKDT